MPILLTVAGARPQFVKVAPVSRALKEVGLSEILVHTGQHFDANMSDVFFDELGIAKPDFNLDIHSLGHGAMTGRMLEALEAILLEKQIDMVLVYGDTNSTLAAALAASKLSIPVAHVEAGLRSFNRTMPEEINRVLTDHVSELLYCPTATAQNNLAAEGLTKGVQMVGDVMYDITLFATDRAAKLSTILTELNLEKKRYGVATLHRQENTDDPVRLKTMVELLETAALDQPVVLPLHPRTRGAMRNHGLSFNNVRTIAPLGYLDMVQLVHHSAAVFTDSGGLQKEAYFHRVPCVTLRDETEWVETIEAGWNRLWTQSNWLDRRDIPDYGTGDASQIIANSIAQHLS